MNIPDSVVLVRDYLQAKERRQDAEKPIARLRKLEVELVAAKEKEADLLAKINPDSLISAKSVKCLNEMLAGSRPLGLLYDGIVLPLSFARLVYQKGELRVAIVFGKPLFCGWETVQPHKSFQTCSLSPVTPEPPSENHIARYRQVTEQPIPIACWERVENKLRLWAAREDGVITFVLGDATVAKKEVMSTDPT